MWRMKLLPCRSLAIRGAVALGAVLWPGPAEAQPGPENLGQSQQSLVVPGTVVDAATREAQGLLTLTTPEGTCSASMLNDYWAITAAHCIFSRTAPCPQFTPDQIQVTANWPRNSPQTGWLNGTKTVQARQLVTYGTPASCPTSILGTPNDVALLQVGLRDFGRPDVRERKLEEQRPQSNAAVTAYGRGINALAFMQGATPVPTQSDGQYRGVEFAITGVTANEFSFFGGAGATIAGGDSGGPSLVQDWDNPLSPQRRLEWRLVGVHSRCNFICLPGQTCTGATIWRWVSQINQCWDASIVPIRDAILAAITAVPPDDSFVGNFGTVPPEVLARKRALYAVSIDEPLIAPTDAAIDVQLTFASCHQLMLNPGCPVERRYEEWAYDPANRRILHVQSGKCLNISGARHDPGAPIILYPCSNAPNEKWSMAGSSIVTFRSDLTGLCLHAIPGRLGQRTGQFMTLPSPASLTQMRCDGSTAQQFSDVDADWHRRHGPR
jgi:hypothetical protein